MNLKKTLITLCVLTIFSTNLNSMYQEPQLNLQLHPEEFDWKNSKHIKILKTSYNNNLRMIIIIACSIREMIPIEDKDITLSEGQRIIYICKKNKYGNLIYENGKLVFKKHLIEAIDPRLKKFIEKLILLIEQTTPELFTNDELIPHYKRMGLIEKNQSYLDQDPTQIRADNNLTIKQSRIEYVPGIPAKNIVNVNEKFIECLNTLEIILKLMEKNCQTARKKFIIGSNKPPKSPILVRKKNIPSSPKHFFDLKKTSKTKTLKIISNLLNQITIFFQDYEKITGRTARKY